MAARTGDSDLVALVGAAHHAVQARLAARLRAGGHEGATPSWQRAFRALTGGRMTLSALAEGMGVTKQTAAAVVDAMERDGCVERLTSIADRRVKLLVLTDRGRDAAAAGARVARELERAVADEAGPQGVEALRRALAVVAGGAIRPGAPGHPHR